MVRLLILCALLTAFASPTARERIRPYLSPVLDPAYEWSTRSRVNEIARKLATEQAAGRGIPKPGSIEAFVARNYPQAGAEFVRMSGSGATWFAWFDSEVARDAANAACPATWWHLASFLR